MTSSSAASLRMENFARPSASSSRTVAAVIFSRSRPAGWSALRVREGGRLVEPDAGPGGALHTVGRGRHDALSSSSGLCRFHGRVCQCRFCPLRTPQEHGGEQAAGQHRPGSDQLTGLQTGRERVRDALPLPVSAGRGECGGQRGGPDRCRYERGEPRVEDRTRAPRPRGPLRRIRRACRWTQAPTPVS